MLEELTEKTGLNKTDFLRQAIRREYADRIGERPATRKPKRR